MPLIAAVGSPQSVGPTSGGKVWPSNTMSQTAQQIVGPNPNRVSLTFANPGNQTAYVAPTTDAQGKPIVLTLTSLGGSFPIFPGAIWTVSGEVQVAWQGLIALGASQPFTVMESNV